MASFSKQYPWACHVLPIMAAKEIWRSENLKSKAELGKHGIPRETTSKTDITLGFSDHIHFYLLRDTFRYEELPILNAQLKPSKYPPFPHIALLLRTENLTDDESMLCNWNIALGRPKIPGYWKKPGNWPRGTDPAIISEHWKLYRASNPIPEKAFGYFHSEFLLPVLRGQQIQDNLSLLKGNTRNPELLLTHRFAIGRCHSLHSFSKADFQLMQLLGPPPGNLPLLLQNFQGYSETDLVPSTIRESVRRYFSGIEQSCPKLNFDAKR